MAINEIQEQVWSLNYSYCMPFLWNNDCQNYNVLLFSFLDVLMPMNLVLMAIN